MQIDLINNFFIFLYFLWQKYRHYHLPVLHWQLILLIGLNEQFSKKLLKFKKLKFVRIFSFILELDLMYVKRNLTHLTVYNFEHHVSLFYMLMASQMKKISQRYYLLLQWVQSPPLLQSRTYMLYTYYIYTIQVRRNEKHSGGATNFEILSATVVDRRRKLLISNRLKGLEKVNICRRWVL